MKWRIYSKKGLTLTELLVSSVIIGLVMIGVVSFNYTVAQLGNTSSRTTQVKVRAAAAMAQIKRDLALAVGDPQDPGVFVYREDNAFSQPHAASLCIRQDVNDPTSYADDRWICYHHGSSYGISRYVWDPGTGPSSVFDANPRSCEEYIECGSGNANATEQFHIINMPDSPPAPIHFIYAADDNFTNTDEMYDSNGTVTHFEIYLTIRHDPDSAAHPTRNPQVSLETSIYPVGHSGPIDAADIQKIGP